MKLIKETADCSDWLIIEQLHFLYQSQGLKLLALCLLFWSGPVLGCDWDQTTDPNQGLDPNSLNNGARYLDQMREVSDPESCRTACCEHPDCDLVLVGFPMDGGQQCMLVSCGARGHDACTLQRSSQFQVFRRKAQQEAEEEAPEAGEKLRVVPLEDSGEPRSNGELVTGYWLLVNDDWLLVNDGWLVVLEGEGLNCDDRSVTAALRCEEVSGPTGSSGSSKFNFLFRCRLPMKVGLCRAAFPRFFYNVTSQTCSSFIYGGCEANDNNFETQEECEAACSGVTGEAESQVRWDLSPVFNPCSERFLCGSELKRCLNGSSQLVSGSTVTLMNKPRRVQLG
uniref:BPTI/Kunitz inhibitor domain-containing protein n=1 Tax=Kryptolebias marmoratus TaxID=37003 RepID=A0A3Q2ZSD1_KRYMA